VAVGRKLDLDALELTVRQVEALARSASAFRGQAERLSHRMALDDSEKPRAGFQGSRLPGWLDLLSEG